MRNNSIKQNNKGFSLVELIVVVLITGILMLAVGLFMTTSRTAYMTVNTSATLQEEAMTVERVLSEYCMEAYDFGLKKDADLDVAIGDVFWIQARENDGTPGAKDPIYFFVRDKNKNVLKFGKGTEGMASAAGITPEGVAQIKSDCYGTNDKYSLVAEHIKSISINKTKALSDGTHLIVLEVGYSYMEKEYIDTITIVTRNKNK